jgi:HEAT repeat protein
MRISTFGNVLANRRSFLKSALLAAGAGALGAPLVQAAGPSQALGIGLPLIVCELLPAQNAEEKAKLEMRRSFEANNGKTMIEWMNDLKSKDPSVVEFAVANLKFYGQDARDASREMIKFAARGQVHDVSLRVNAIISLGFIGFYDNDVKDGINVLTSALGDNQEIVRYQAAVALRRLAANAYPATAALISAMKTSNSWEVRRAAAATLGIVARQNPVDKGFDRGAYSALIERLTMNEGLGDIAQEVRMEAIIALIRFGLPGSLVDRDREKRALASQASRTKQAPKVKIWAHVALWMLERGPGQNGLGRVGQQHLAAIAGFLKNPDLQAREHAVRALGVIGPDAGSRVPDLIDVLEDKNPGIVVLACAALSSMGDAARPALPALERLNRHTDPDVRDTARQAIEKIKEKPKVIDSPVKSR